MLKFIYSLFMSKAHRKIMEDLELKVRRDEFEAAFELIESLLPVKDGTKYTGYKFKINHHVFTGGWLSSSFYFDVYKTKNNEPVGPRLGRLHIGPSVLSNDTYHWRCYDGSSCKFGVNAAPLKREHFAQAINSLVPNLVKEETINEQ